EIIIGNYNHLFDPHTRALTDGVVDERTFVIVDEAHRLEGRVRDLLSDRIGIQSLRRARNDIAHLYTYARQSRENREEIAAQLESYEISTDELDRAREFYDDAIDWLNNRISNYLEAEFDDLDRAELPDDIELPLRDPDTEEPDEFSEWARENGYSAAFCKSLYTIGTAVEDVLETIEPERSCVCANIGLLLTRWWTRDHAAYFREVTLERTQRERATEWERHYTAALVCYNCLPAEDLRERFSDLGGGVLMSATLEPMDVFCECVGLDTPVREQTEDGENGDDGAVERPLTNRTYDLTYPGEHRASWIVDVPAFTARNRGPPSGENEVRETYAYALREIARSPGNVLLCLPSYREAAWAGERLGEALEKPVLVDEPSTDEATEERKQAFFAGDGKVLVTSARGTLTEGVDYDGEKLSVCAVVGVPLVNIASPRIRAVRRAYGAAFTEENSFEYALTVPAVRRARQAIGRVIRGPEEVGVRLLVDERYTPDAPRSVYEYLPPVEREEWVTMTPMFLDSQFERFRKSHTKP
ncbi:MAG TPA: ATP-dependent DNA helicase, partial [Halococcus sp.]|nr:ATP-dependent DNA helicase [Halococcus sp.]